LCQAESLAIVPGTIPRVSIVADSAEATGLKWAAPASGSTFSGANVYKDPAQAISNATWTNVTWNQETFDTDAFHDNSTNNSRFTIPSGKNGYYLITACLQFLSNPNGFRASVIRKNASDYAKINWVTANSGDSTILVGSTTVSCVATDYIEVQVYQNSGGNLNINYGASESSFTITYLGA